MGFTWIFAFSAAFSGASALWYIYIIINSLQGLYIFFAFTFNRRIGQLWKGKLTGTLSVDKLFESSTTSKLGNRTLQRGDKELANQTGATLLSGHQEEKSSISSSKL